jgi:hypothetical protein
VYPTLLRTAPEATAIGSIAAAPAVAAVSTRRVTVARRPTFAATPDQADNGAVGTTGVRIDELFAIAPGPAGVAIAHHGRPVLNRRALGT